MNVVNLHTKKHNRMGFIGGTDAIKIMNGKWHELWLEKTGQADPTDLSDVFRVQLGVATEEFNIKWFCKQYLYEYKDLMKQTEFEKTFDDVPYKGTVDAVHEEFDFIVECKHTGSWNTYQKQLEYYMAQLQFYMAVSGTSKTYFSVIFGNEWECRTVGFDITYFNKLRDRIAEFWQYVKFKKEPNDIDIPTINIDSIHVNDMVRRDASKDNHFKELAEIYKATKQSHKDHDKAKKELRSIILPSESEIYNEDIKVIKDSRGIVKVMEIKQ